MPDANGQMYAADHIAELQDAGFSGFTPALLLTFVNRGYFHVARKSQWTWEQTTDTFSLAPGSPFVDLWPVAGGKLPNFRALDKLYITTAGSEGKLQPLTDDQFFKNYLNRDLTAASARSNPSGYYVYENKLYILPPPQATRAFTAHYHRRPGALTAATDVTGIPITPVHLDEAIQIAARIRAHRRAIEPSLADVERGNLEDFFDDMRDDESNLMEEQPDRVTPDNTWL